MTDDKREAILKKIRALQAKARDEASSEAEAIAATERMAKLMERHDVLESELVEKGANLSARQGEVFVGRGTLHPTLNYIWSHLAQLTQTKILFYNRAGYMKPIGQPQDVEYAVYLIEVILGAVERGWRAYWKEYKGRLHGKREDHRHSYRCGFALGLRPVLAELNLRRRSAATTGTALIVSKEAAIEAFITEHELNPRNARKQTKKVVGHHAYNKGVTAGSETALERPLENKNYADQSHRVQSQA